MPVKLTVAGALAQIPSAIILFSADFIMVAASFIGLAMVRVVDYVSGTNAERAAFHGVRYKCDPVPCAENPQEIDVAKSLAKSNYPIPPHELIALCKALLKKDFGCSSPELLAEDFQFVAPIVGPLSKQEFTKSFSEFGVKVAFPDARENFFGFSVDPQEPNRVWMFSRASSTHTGPLKFGGRVIQPTNVHVVHPPQALSMLFDEDGQCYTLTVGYVMDKRIGNTGGMGGLFGPLYAVGHGLPVLEGKPWKPSLRLQALERVQKAALAFGFGT